MFKQSNQNLRVIDLIDKHGNSSCEVQEGRINTTSYQSILQALELCASCYQCKGKMFSVDDHLGFLGSG
jgi:hypothetical protein